MWVLLSLLSRDTEYNAVNEINTCAPTLWRAHPSTLLTAIRAGHILNSNRPSQGGLRGPTPAFGCSPVTQTRGCSHSISQNFTSSPSAWWHGRGAAHWSYSAHIPTPGFCLIDKTPHWCGEARTRYLQREICFSREPCCLMMCLSSDMDNLIICHPFLLLSVTSARIICPPFLFLNDIACKQFGTTLQFQINIGYFTDCAVLFYPLCCRTKSLKKAFECLTASHSMGIVW